MKIEVLVLGVSRYFVVYLTQFSFKIAGMFSFQYYYDLICYPTMCRLFYYHTKYTFNKDNTIERRRHHLRIGDKPAFKLYQKIVPARRSLSFEAVPTISVGTAVPWDTAVPPDTKPVVVPPC